MQTQHTGSKYQAIIEEALQLPRSTLWFRLRWETGKLLGRHKRRRAPSTLTNEDVVGMFPLGDRSPRGLLEHFRTRDNVRFFFGRGDLPRIREIWRDRTPKARAPLLAAAERACRHEFEFLGAPRVTFEGNIDWHDALNGGGRWPQEHWSTIDIRSNVRDIKHIWELNRTQFFVTLARAYALTGEELFAVELCAQWRSWLEQNPPEIGANWWSSLECGLRCTSWLFALEMTMDWSGWEPDLFCDVIRSLIDHQQHISKDIVLSESEPVSNHLIGDAMGIALISLYLPEMAGASAYRARALRVLFEQAPIWFTSDGIGVEMAVSYKRFVFQMYLLTGLLLEANGHPVSPTIWTGLERLAEFIMHIHAPTGKVSQFGDWDSGRAVVLDESPPTDFASMLCTAAIRFRRGDLKHAAGEFREEALWLLGPSAVDAFDGLCDPDKISGNKHWPVSGICVWRTDWTREAEYVFFKCSPYAWHTHADNLNLLYSAAGKDWLVDRGTYTYNGPWEWRTHFRGTSAHNAVLVDGYGQALAHRAFRWLRQPKQVLDRHHTGERVGYVAGTTTGRRHLRSPVRHTRSVLIVHGTYIVVLDELEARGRHNYQLLFQIAPRHEVVIAAQGLVRTNDPTGPNFLLRTIGSGETEPRVALGETEPIQGWHSREYGHKEPAPTVVCSAEAAETMTFLTVLCVVPGPADAAVLELSVDDWADWSESRAARVLGPGFDDRIYLPDPRMPCDSVEAQPSIERAGRKIPIF